MKVLSLIICLNFSLPLVADNGKAQTSSQGKEEIAGSKKSKTYLPTYEKNREKRLQGEIVDVLQTPIPRMSSPMLELRIKAKTNPAVMASVAPIEFVAKKGFQFKEGQKVTLMGSLVEVAGVPMLLTKEIKTSDGKSLALRTDDGEPLFMAKKEFKGL